MDIAMHVETTSAHYDKGVVIARSIGDARDGRHSYPL